MHILFLTNEYPYKNEAHGGIGTFIKFLAEQLIENNIKISVLGVYNIQEDETYKLNKIDVYRLKISKWKFAKFYDHKIRILKCIKEIHKKKQIDIIEGSELNFAFFPYKSSYKKVIRLHGGHHFFASEEQRKVNNWKAYQEKISFKKADNFVAVSNYVGYKTKRLLKNNFTYTTIYNSIDLRPFYKSSYNKEHLYKLLFVGTVCYKKGIDSLIDAIPIIKKKYPNVVLEIIGRDWVDNNGNSYTGLLKKRIKDIDKHNIKFTGSIPYKDIPRRLEEAQLCVYPSISESFGLTLIEGMAMGKAIIASNIKPFNEIVGNSNSVLFFKPNSKEDISEKVVHLFSDHKKRLELIEKSRKHILECFDSDSILEDNISFYKSILR
ncbi:glycosyltransferase family 4 protein [Polaribacter marinaquae]|uniref:Glycosyltransferase family 4 protein n=1 Tax=Polaribacter marinaquae TaxID=1642819 RepID=A0ABZ2TS90_9FLAO